jgi:hypothetical protein
MRDKVGYVVPTQCCQKEGNRLYCQKKGGRSVLESRNSIAYDLPFSTEKNRCNALALNVYPR